MIWEEDQLCAEGEDGGPESGVSPLYYEIEARNECYPVTTRPWLSGARFEFRGEASARSCVGANDAVELTFPRWLRVTREAGIAAVREVVNRPLITVEDDSFNGVAVDVVEHFRFPVGVDAR